MSIAPSVHRRSVVVGAACGIGAATLWGASAPVSKLLLPHVQPLMLAALLYLGAGAGLTLFSLVRPRTARLDEAPMRAVDVPLIAGMTLLGGVCGPVLLLFGLERLSGVAASLLLNLEAPFTIALAVLLFREHLPARGTLAAFIVIAGALLLAWHTGGAVSASWVGVVCVVGACLAWGADNNLTQRVSLRDPITVVRYKTIPAGCITFALALLFGERVPSGRVLLASLALGAVSYGAGIVLHVFGLRLLGAARQAAFFATAPFVGAVASLLVLGERLSVFDAVGGAVMAAGVALLLTESHAHEHVHEVVEHEHAHVHDEHHAHEHGDGIAVHEGRAHAHVHRHEALVHSHAHVSDVHHRHDHT